MLRFIIILSLSFSAFIQAQEDTTIQINQNYKAIEVISIVTVPSQNELNRENIDLIQPIDAGDLLQRTAGVTLRNYGDVGGLKTISLNGVGAQHNGLVVNGNVRSNPQSGLADYSQIAIDNIDYLIISNHFENIFGNTVTSLSTGNTVNISTLEYTFPLSILKLKASYKIGSFGEHTFFGAVKKKFKKSYLALTFNHKSYEGEYDYNLKTQGINIIGTRTNNQYKQSNIGFGLGYKLKRKSPAKRASLRLTGNYNSIENNLPGAVILYNTSSDESLFVNRFNLGLDLLLSNSNKKSVMTRVYSTFQTDDFRYLDPTYFNSEGKIDNTYINNSSTVGFLSNKEIKKNLFTVVFGSEVNLAQLKSNRTDFATPQRITSNSLVKGNFKKKNIKISTMLGFFHTSEQNRSNNTWLTPRNSLNPSVKLELNKNNWINISGLYKKSFRLPTFNELYYSQIGNINLEPEKAHQFNIGIKGFSKTKVQFYSKFKFKANAYFNIIENKIQAIPTKNVFVWSMQNVGNVNSYGVTASTNWNAQVGKLFKLALNGNITLQKVVNRNKLDTINFNSTLAYEPSLLANVGFVITCKEFNLLTEYSFVGERYALNQNIYQNLVESYGNFNVNLSKQFKIKDKNTIRIQGGIKNVANKTNHFIRYFVLPGRSFFLKLSYAFN